MKRVNLVDMTVDQLVERFEAIALAQDHALTLAVVPQEARRLVETIAESHEFPQAGDAGMTLDALDRGTFKPT